MNAASLFPSTCQSQRLRSRPHTVWPVLDTTQSKISMHRCKSLLQLLYRNPVILKKKSKVRMRNLRAARKVAAEASTSQQSDLQHHDRSPLPPSSPLPPLTSSPVQLGRHNHQDKMPLTPMSDLRGGDDGPGSPLPPSSPPSPLTSSLVQFARHYCRQDISPVPKASLHRGRSGSPTAQYVARRGASRIRSVQSVSYVLRFSASQIRTVR